MGYSLRSTMLLLLQYILLVSFSTSLKVSIFGASGGIGQLLSKRLVELNAEVNAVTRRAAETSEKFGNNLAGCNIIEADARDIKTIPNTISNADFIVLTMGTYLFYIFTHVINYSFIYIFYYLSTYISFIGTTAFPTAKWENEKNKPKIACLDTVENVLQCIRSTNHQKLKGVILVSSVGVERRTQFPFSILNSYGILDYKYESENVVINNSKKLNYTPIIIRPGRLVGEPFTNFDLAKLLKLTKGNKKNVSISYEDVLAGDCERADVAELIALIITNFKSLQFKNNRISLINIDGGEPDWGSILKSL